MVPTVKRADVSLRSLFTLAEQYSQTDPESAVVKLRIIAESVVDNVYDQAFLPRPQTTSLYDLAHFGAFAKRVPSETVATIDRLRVIGNSGAHGRGVLPDVAVRALRDTEALLQWFEESFAPVAASGNLNPPMEVRLDDTPNLYLVRQGETTTVLVVRHGELQVLRSHAPLLLFGDGEQLWRWIPSADLTWINAARPSEEDHLLPTVLATESGFLLNVITGQRLPMPSKADKGRDDYLYGYHSETVLLDSVGRYCLRADLSDSYHGGAHNEWGRRFSVFDLVSGAELDPIPSAWMTPGCRTKMERIAKAQLMRSSGERVEEVEPTLFFFAFTKSGETQLRYQFTAEACFAGSDGKWDSYTQSTYVDCPRFPADFEAYATTPPPVLAWCKQQSQRISGWSVLSPALEPIVMAQVDTDRCF